jgi:hypothetical protein
MNEIRMRHAVTLRSVWEVGQGPVVNNDLALGGGVKMVMWIYTSRNGNGGNTPVCQNTRLPVSGNKCRFAHFKIRGPRKKNSPPETALTVGNG